MVKYQEVLHGSTSELYKMCIRDSLAMENLLGHGETRTKEGRERGQEWIMKRFCRIE